MTLTMGPPPPPPPRDRHHDASPFSMMSGHVVGTTFSSCLERAIRRRRRSLALDEDDDDIDIGGNHKDSEHDISIDGGKETNDEQGECGVVVGSDGEDWSSHHISYPLLLSTLTYFSRRRAGVHARLLQLLQDSNCTIDNNDAGSDIITNYNNVNNLANDSNEDHTSSLLCCCVGNGKKNKPQMSEEEFNLIVNEFANQAPFWKRDEEKDRTRENKASDNVCGEGGDRDGGEVASVGSVSGEQNNNLMEFAEQRALGRTPPGGKITRKRMGNGTKKDTVNNDDTVQYNNVTEGVSSIDSPYLRMRGEGNDSSMNPNNIVRTMMATMMMTMLDESEITKRLSYMERSELSAVLDSEAERAATFYRARISKLAPPRIDGGTCPTVFALCGDFDMPAAADNESSYSLNLCNNGHEFNNDYDDELIAPSQEREHFSFTDLASEILELHAFITTNIIVVRQVLIKYDAFVRSLGGAPMGSWYQTTRRQRVNGRCSDYLDLENHSKLATLTRAYILEYERHHLEDNDEEDAGAFNMDDYVESGLGGRMRDQSKRKGRRGKRRLTNLSRVFYKLFDASEEIKRRQRLKWRQSAMHVGLNDVNTFAPEERMELVDADTPATRISGGHSTRTTPHLNTTALDTIPEVSMPMLSHTHNTTSHSGDGNSKLLERTPNPPPHPLPDYSTLKKHSDLGEDIAYQVHIFKCIQSKTERSIEKTYNGRISGARDNILYTLRELFLLGSVSDNLSLMPEYLILRGKSLKSSLLAVAQWREARDAYRQGLTRVDLSPSSSVAQPCSSSFRDSFALFLNISACFLYMMNYYIVMPSSIQYANALGAEDAMAGLIIGAMPTAAIFSAIVFSIWSNKCYRAPLLTSGALLIAGNALYATAYRHQSMTMVLCGRFLTGLGGPRSMNRRFIADTTPLAQRTAANAAFGMATAMGAALGPAAAILLDRIDIQLNFPLIGSMYINGMSGPGYVMGMLWSMYTLVLALTFVEPKRSGLEEQIRNELLRSMTETVTKVPPESDNDASPHSEEMKTGRLAPNTNDGSYSFSTENGQDHINNTDTTPRYNTIHASTEPIVHPSPSTLWQQATFLFSHLTFPVRLCLFLLFTKMFTVESVISSASIVTKNRYLWAVQQVGALGTIVGCLTIPISVFIGWASQYREDRVLMLWLMSFATVGMGLLIDVSDFVSSENETYNEGNALAVGSRRYIAGYLIVFCSVQAFDGVVGSMLSKVIPTALATGTLNSGLLATVVGTFGRACGDIFITSVGYISLRQILNLLFVPSFLILSTDLVLLCCYYDSLTA